MTTAVIGATRRVGSEIVRGVLARGDAVAADRFGEAAQVTRRGDNRDTLLCCAWQREERHQRGEDKAPRQDEASAFPQHG